MSQAQPDIPEAAARRVGESAFTSGLTIPDFAACLEAGLEPVGLVQGFCVMQWQWYGANSPYGLGPGRGLSATYQEQWRCPHNMISAEHRAWGQNYQQPWLEQAWMEGYTSAYKRMMEEATDLGSHGVVGVIDGIGRLGDLGVVEFRIRGTAVRVADGAPPHQGRPWSTYLAGQRLNKLVEAGYAPVSIAATLSSVRIWAACTTQYQMEGGSLSPWGSMAGGGEVDQVVSAHTAVRNLARTSMRRQLGNDSLHGANMDTATRAFGEGDAELQCTIKGNRVRRFAAFEPVQAPRPTVRLS